MRILPLPPGIFCGLSECGSLLCFGQKDVESESTISFLRKCGEPVRRSSEIVRSYAILGGSSPPVVLCEANCTARMRVCCAGTGGFHNRTLPANAGVKNLLASTLNR